MMFEEDYSHIGKTLKTHGYKGELLILLESSERKELKNKEHVFLDIDGIYVPFFIENIQRIDDDRIVVKLEDINSDIDAEEFRGVNVYLANKSTKKNKQNFGMNDLVGFSFLELKTNQKGKITEFVEIPGNPLIKVLMESNQEILIPYHNDFIARINIKSRILEMNLPEGLMDQY